MNDAEFKKLKSKQNETLKIQKEIKEYFIRITLDIVKLRDDWEKTIKTLNDRLNMFKDMEDSMLQRIQSLEARVQE